MSLYIKEEFYHWIMECNKDFIVDNLMECITVINHRLLLFHCDEIEVIFLKIGDSEFIDILNVGYNYPISEYIL